MNRPTIAILAMAMTCAVAHAENLPDLKGTWSGPFKTVILGNNPRYPGNETIIDPPRILPVEITFEIEGQDGRLAWGKSWSDLERKEPFVGTITADGKRFLGADSNSSIDADISNPELLDVCYTQTGLSETHSIVASCGQIRRSN